MKDYCPACASEVEYEAAGQNASCSICGRTKSAAEQTVLSRATKARDAKLKRLWIGLGIVAVIGFILMNVIIGHSERTLGILISTMVQVIGLAAFVWLFIKARDWFEK